MNSERETPRSRAARESSRWSSGPRAMVVAFFLESATQAIWIDRADGQGQPRLRGDARTCRAGHS